MKNAIRVNANPLRQILAAVVCSAVAMVGAGSASAAVPAVVGTTLTEIQTDAIAIGDLVWPVVLTVFGSLLLIKLAKRYGSKI